MSNVSPTYTIVIMPMRSTTADARTAASHGMDIRMVQRLSLIHISIIGAR